MHPFKIIHRIKFEKEGMERILISFLLICSSLFIQAQTNLDSLYQIWKDTTQSDSLRAMVYNKYVHDGFVFSNPDSAIILADELFLFAKEKNYLKAQAAGLNLQGLAFWVKSDFPKALDLQAQSVKIKEQLGDKRGMAGSLINMGNIYNTQGYYPKALQYYQRGIKICEEIGEERFKANALNNIGLIYKKQGEYVQALEYFTQSLQIWEQLDNKKGMAMLLINLGSISSEKGDLTQALSYCQRGLRIAEEISEMQFQANALLIIGDIHKDLNDYTQAIDHYTQGLKIQEQLGDQGGIANSLLQFGIILKDQGNYSKSLDYCHRSYKLALPIGLLDIQKDACQCLYEIYKYLGKGNEALVYLEKMRIVEDSLNAEETTKKLEQMEFAKIMLQDSIAKAEEARLLELAHEKQIRTEKKTRNIAFGGGGFLLLLAGALFMRMRFIRKSKAILQIEKDRSEHLLLNILPEEIAQELKEKGKADARDFDQVSILFTDFKGFTAASEKLSAQDLVGEINTCFEAFDGIIGKYHIEKIKTIGDAYMAAGGLPVPTNDSVKNTVLAALEMQEFISKRKLELDASGKPGFEMRVGIHTGSVVAGIVGVKKFQYDIWGDTVNTASRMESSGEVGKVNISQATYALIKDDPAFAFESRGKIEAKGKGEIVMHFVSKV